MDNGSMTLPKTDRQIPVKNAIPMERLAEELKALGIKAFRLRYNHHFLRLLEGKIEVVSPIDLRTLEDAGGSKFASLGLGKDFSNLVVPLARSGKKPGVLCVGRANDADVVIASKWISKEHAVFEVEGDEVRLRDLGSRNGTSLNQRALSREDPPIRLRSGDVIAFWKYSFEFLDISTLIDCLADRS